MGRVRRDRVTKFVNFGRPGRGSGLWKNVISCVFTFEQVDVRSDVFVCKSSSGRVKQVGSGEAGRVG